MKSREYLEDVVAREMDKGDITQVVVGVSGGADSMALLTSLYCLNLRITAVHCNFHLRGDESNRDMEFVSEFCRQRDIPLLIVDFNVEAYRTVHGGSVEMACRNLRYSKFDEIMAQTGADRIAIAHNADDQAETVLLNLMRGSGVSGLKGMVPDTGRIIRPLLTISRRAIEEYLSIKGVSYIIDSSNLSSDYRRNFLRNEVLPLLRTRWPEATKSLCQTAAIMQSEEKVLIWAQEHAGLLEGRSLPFKVILSAPDERWAIHRFISRFEPTTKVASEILQSIHSDPLQTGKQWRLGRGILTLERDSLEFTPDLSGLKIEVKCEEYEVDEKLLRSILTAPLDELWTTLPPDKIKFRFYTTGDRIRGLGNSGSTKVSKILKDNKLSYARKMTTIIAEESDMATGESEIKTVLWVAGLKRSRQYLIGTDTDVAYRYTVNLPN